MRRRRRRRARQASEGTDAFDLFLDALCNGLGVVMFILMIVALFAKPPAGGGEESELRRLKAELESLQTNLEATIVALKAAPPPGSPELRERYERALERLDQARQRREEALQRIEIHRETIQKRESEIEDAQRRLALESQKQEEIRAKIQQLRESTAFVRTSRWNKDDARQAKLLLVSGGLVSAPATLEEEIRPLAGVGSAVHDIATAEAAMLSLLQGTTPATHRIEIAVWPDSYAAFKHLEKALVEEGYAIQPLPVAAGKPLTSGDGGSQ